MRECNIIIEPYELLSVLELKIKKEINEHATATIIGYICENDYCKYINQTTENIWLKIYAKDANEDKKILFVGIVQSVEEITTSELRKIKIQATSGSILADINKRTRTFQDGTNSFNSVFSRIIEEDSYLRVNSTCLGSNIIDSFLVQYSETNWEFIKRLASHFNSYVVADYETNGCNIYFGSPNKIENADLSKEYFSIKKDIDEYRFKIRNGIKDYLERDAMEYSVSSREIYSLCSKIIYNKKELYIKSIDTSYEKGELIHKYVLKSEAGLKEVKKYNYSIIGASLMAVIKEIEKDNVKVTIDIDKGNAKSIDRWFPYSTVYSSPDGTGWYFMPEIDDTVRLYFPSESENDAFIISAVHEQSTDQRNNPDNKSISTSSGKRINFNPNSIEIISDAGMQVSLTDEQGVEIISSTDINFKAEKDIIIQSGQGIYMSGAKGVKMEVTKNIEQNKKPLMPKFGVENLVDSTNNNLMPKLEPVSKKIEINENQEIIIDGMKVKMN